MNPEQFVLEYGLHFPAVARNKMRADLLAMSAAAERRGYAAGREAAAAALVANAELCEAAASGPQVAQDRPLCRALAAELRRAAARIAALPAGPEGREGL